MQVWLALNNLLGDPACRSKYILDEFRKESVMRLRRFLNDVLLDQLPVLKDLQRVLDELAFNCRTPCKEYQAGVVIEQVQSLTCGGLSMTGCTRLC
jgi:zinc finger MYND domain-containing protein 10